MTEKALILFAHGARDPEWARPVQAVAMRLQKADLDSPVAVAFLEFMSPTLPDVIAEICSDQIKAGKPLSALQIDILPFFIAQGGHLRQEVPDMLKTLGDKYEQLKLRLLPPLGELPSVQEAMANAITQLLKSKP